MISISALNSCLGSSTPSLPLGPGNRNQDGVHNNNNNIEMVGLRARSGLQVRSLFLDLGLLLPLEKEIQVILEDNVEESVVHPVHLMVHQE